MADQYRWKKGRWELGPATLDDMRKMVRSGALARVQSVSKDGGKSWSPASEFSEFWDATAVLEPIDPPAPRGHSLLSDHDNLQIEAAPARTPRHDEAVQDTTARSDGGVTIAGFITATAALSLLCGLTLVCVLGFGSPSWFAPATFLLFMAAVTGLVLSAIAFSSQASGLAKAGLVTGICGSLLGLAVSIGALTSQESDTTHAVAPTPRAAPDQDNGEQASGLSISELGSTTYKVRAVLVDHDQHPVALESLSIYASPKAIVQKQLGPAIAQHEQELKELGDRRQELVSHLEKTRARLTDEETAIAEEYEAVRPQQGDRDVRELRNPLKELSKARATKSKADEWYARALRDRIEPIKGEITKTENAIADFMDKQRNLQSELKDRVFKAVSQVPKSQKKVCKTLKDGFASIELPTNEPWTVWAVAEHEKYVGKNIVWSSTAQAVGPEGWSSSGKIRSTDIVQKKQVRWLLDVPEELDDNKLLTLDLETAFDSQVISIESGGNDGPQIRKHRTAR